MTKLRLRFKKIPRQTLFFTFAAIMLGIILTISVYNLIFLISNFNKALNPRAVKNEIQEFDIAGFEKLDLINQPK